MSVWFQRAFHVLWTDENAARRWTRALMLGAGAAILSAPGGVFSPRVGWGVGTALVVLGGLIHVPTASALQPEAKP